MSEMLCSVLGIQHWTKTLLELSSLWGKKEYWMIVIVEPDQFCLGKVQYDLVGYMGLDFFSFHSAHGYLESSPRFHSLTCQFLPAACWVVLLFFSRSVLCRSLIQILVGQIFLRLKINWISADFDLEKETLTHRAFAIWQVRQEVVPLVK